MNFLLHSGHWNLFSPVCVRRCLCNEKSHICILGLSYGQALPEVHNKEPHSLYFSSKVINTHLFIIITTLTPQIFQTLFQGATMVYSMMLWGEQTIQHQMAGISEWRIGRDVERCGHGLFWGTMMASAWRDWRKPWKSIRTASVFGTNKIQVTRAPHLSIFLCPIAYRGSQMMCNWRSCSCHQVRIIYSAMNKNKVRYSCF